MCCRYLGHKRLEQGRLFNKEQKLYLWDWSLVPESVPRFENFVASQLLKYCHFIEDTEGFRMDLRFLRDTDKREVDFVSYTQEEVEKRMGKWVAE